MSKLGELLNLQYAGAFKITINPTEDSFEICGIKLTEKACETIVDNIGWKKYYIKPHELITKTDRFVSGIRNGLYDDKLMAAEVEFENSRISESERTVNRVSMKITSVFNVRIVYGAGGGGKYLVYGEENMFTTPVLKAKTLREVGEWLSAKVSE